VQEPESSSTTKTSATSDRAGPSTARVVSAGMIGTIIEFFDFFIYATVSSLVFGKLFFPGDNEFVSTMLVWGTFAAGYLARPLGGLLFGHFGDKIGRSRILFVTLLMMGVSTTVIGLLPSYSQIGIAAPIILVSLRVIQGLGVGGEYGGATLMVIEHTHRSGRRGLWGALVTAGSSIGVLLATGLMALLTAVTTDEQFLGWAWRIPFLLSSALLLVGFYIRYRLGETPVMENAIEHNATVKAPILELLRNHRKVLLIALGAPLGNFAAYYIVLVFSVPFAVTTAGLNQSVLLTISSLAQVTYVGSVIFGGYMSDRLGRRLPMMGGAVGLALWSFAFFPLLLSGAKVAVFFAFAVSLFCVGLIVGPMAAFLAELFGTGVRFSGLSVGYQVSAAVAGGLAPAIAAFLLHETGSWHLIPVFVTIALTLTFVAVFASKDRTNIALD
jgi:MFS family permease